MSLQPATASATHSKIGAAQEPRLSFILLRCIHVVTVVTCPDTRLFSRLAMIPRADPRYVLCGKPVFTFPDHAVIFAHHFDLPHPKQLDPRPATLLNPAANPNTPVFEGLEGDSPSLERVYHAL